MSDVVRTGASEEAAADVVAARVVERTFAVTPAPRMTSVPRWAHDASDVANLQEAAERSPAEHLPGPVQEALRSELSTDVSSVRVHRDVDEASRLGTPAYAIGRDIALAPGAYRPDTPAGLHVLAHEAAHVAHEPAHAGPRDAHHGARSVENTQPARATAVHAYGTPIPVVAHPTVHTMAEYIGLVRRVEAANPGKSALDIATMLMRTKYNSRGWDWLLPSSAGVAGATAGGTVTSDDVTTLTGEFDVDMPGGGQEDASHVVAAIVAAAERRAPGDAGAGGLAARAVQAPPAAITQLDIASWVGDPGSAAGEWASAHPHPNGGTTKSAYMDEFSPQTDMMADVDGVAMTSTTTASGFAFDRAATLSSNLERFYLTASGRTGKNRRFHIFCSVLGIALEPDGVTLTAAAVTNMDTRIHAFADWYTRNTPDILAWMSIASQDTSIFNPTVRAWVERANDWRWFAAQWQDFLQRNLRAEGA